MHAKPDLRVVLKWMITRSGSVITDVIPLENIDLNFEVILSSPENNELPSDVFEIGVSKLGGYIFLAAALACLLYGVFSNPQTSLDEMTRWCFIVGGAVLTAGALGFMIFAGSSGMFLDSEGFKLGADKIPWEHVLSISKKKIETRKRTEHYINVILKTDSPHKCKKGVLNKIGDVRTGKADFKFKVLPVIHSVGVDELEREMKKRWKMMMNESGLPQPEEPDTPNEQTGDEMDFLSD